MNYSGLANAGTPLGEAGYEAEVVCVTTSATEVGRTGGASYSYLNLLIRLLVHEGVEGAGPWYNCGWGPMFIGGIPEYTKGCAARLGDGWPE